jgi:preprotein translocase subunit SecA
MNKQRTVIYEQRKQVLGSDDLKQDIIEIIEEYADQILPAFCEQDKHPEEWDLHGLSDLVKKQFAVQLDDAALKAQPDLDSLREGLAMTLKGAYERKEKDLGPDFLRYLEKRVLLDMIDSLWKEHLLNMDHLKEGIGLRGYGQKDPLVEYKKEGFAMFMDMVNRIKSDTLERLFRVQVVRQEAAMEAGTRRMPQRITLNRGDAEEAKKPAKAENKAGRNDPCPCGSGKKYKKCHGK